MADFVFNVAKGRVNELHDNVNNNTPANSALIVVLLKVAEADAGMKDRDTLADILGNGSTEADFTNYARKTITDAGIGPSTVDDVNDRREADITTDPVWAAAGGASNNTLAALLVCYDPDTTGGTDADIIPLTKHDFVITTNGGDITAVLNAAGYHRAS
jgi:hypothetical protein